jgi:hypothetical protein
VDEHGWGEIRLDGWEGKIYFICTHLETTAAGTASDGNEDGDDEGAKTHSGELETKLY